MLSLAIAAIALAIWQLTEYRAEKFEDLRKRYEEQLQILSKALAAGAHVSAVLLTQTDFENLLNELKNCQDIGCGYGRRDCRESALGCWAENYSINHHLDYVTTVKLQSALKEVLPEYFRSSRKGKNKTKAFLRINQLLAD